MIIEHLPQGWRITIPESENNMEFSYDLPIMTTGLEHIGREQVRIARKFAVRAFSMEQRFKNGEFEDWAKRNNVGDWNDWFHYALKELSEQAWALWREWCDWHFETYGWNAY